MPLDSPQGRFAADTIRVLLMTPQVPVLLVLIDTNSPDEPARVLMSSGDLTTVDVRPGSDAVSSALVRTDGLEMIDLQLEQWMLATAQRLVVLKQRYAKLTPRERQALPLITEGMRNKQAASALGISAATLQIYRGRIMQKMSAGSFADLVRIADALGIAHRRERYIGMCESSRSGQRRTSSRLGSGEGLA